MTEPAWLRYVFCGRIDEANRKTASLERKRIIICDAEECRARRTIRGSETLTEQSGGWVVNQVWTWQKRWMERRWKGNQPCGKDEMVSEKSIKTKRRSLWRGSQALAQEAKFALIAKQTPRTGCDTQNQTGLRRSGAITNTWHVMTGGSIEYTKVFGEGADTEWAEFCMLTQMWKIRWNKLKSGTSGYNAWQSQVKRKWHQQDESNGLNIFKKMRTKVQASSSSSPSRKARTEHKSEDWEEEWRTNDKVQQTSERPLESGVWMAQGRAVADHRERFVNICQEPQKRLQELVLTLFIWGCCWIWAMRRANIWLIIYTWWLWQVRFAKVAGCIVFFVLPRSVGSTLAAGGIEEWKHSSSECPRSRRCSVGDHVGSNALPADPAPLTMLIDLQNAFGKSVLW